MGAVVLLKEGLILLFFYFSRLFPDLAGGVAVTAAAPGPETGTELGTGAARLDWAVSTAQIVQVRAGQAEGPRHLPAVRAAVQEAALAAGHTQLPTPGSQHRQATLHTGTV